MRRLFAGCLGWSIRPPVEFRLLSLNEPDCKGPVQSAEEEKQEGQPIRAHVNWGAVHSDVEVNIQRRPACSCGRGVGA